MYNMFHIETTFYILKMYKYTFENYLNKNIRLFILWITILLTNNLQCKK